MVATVRVQVVQFLNRGSYSIKVPPGYSSGIQVYAWGAGGGSSTNGIRGGSGAFVSTITNAVGGDILSITVGGAGATGGGAGQGINKYSNYYGGTGNNGAGGGGGATAIYLNSDPIAVAGGGGGGGRSTVGQGGGRFPDMESISWGTVSDGRWGSFINAYGIWPGGTGTKTYTNRIYFPIDGTYTFQTSSDNNASWNIDGGTTYTTSFTAFTGSTTQAVTLTAGYHTINASIANPGDVGGWAMRITNPDTSELWHTRKPTVYSGLNTTTKGGNGSSSGGGGGAGYEYGGIGGGTNRGGNGGQNFFKYGNLTVAGTLIESEVEQGTTSGLPGGDDNEFYPARNIANPGYDGSVIIVFSKQLQIYYKDSGTWEDLNSIHVKVDGVWKGISGAWVKSDGDWKPLITAVTPSSSRVALDPEKGRVEVSLVVAADTTNYNLEGYLKSAGYVAGRTDITLTINPGVTVRSSATSSPALTLAGTRSGDTINLVNDGTIQGRGGAGGLGGQYVAAVSGSSYCFLPGTKIATPFGVVNIEDVKKGDLVHAYDIGSDFNNSAPLEAKAVTETYEHKWDGTTSPLVIVNYTNGQLVTTKEHEILCQNKADPESDFVGFVRAGNLTPGDVIYNAEGQELIVESVINGPEYQYVYNFEVEDFHTFVADGIRVHNGAISSTPSTPGKNIAGRAGGAGGTALRVLRATTITNNGTIAGGGGGGGGGGGPNGGGGGGGAGYGSAGAGSDSGSAGNAGTASAGGAGGSNRGGAGGGRGSAGTAGTSGSSAGGAGGAAGYAVVGTSLVTYSVTGTITGPTSA